MTFVLIHPKEENGSELHGRVGRCGGGGVEAKSELRQGIWIFEPVYTGEYLALGGTG